MPEQSPTGFVASPDGYRPLSPERARVHLVEQQARFAAALASGDPQAPVPTCPGWTLRDLGWHLGTTHRWAAAAVTEGRPVDLEETGPTDRDALVAWYRQAASDLVALLAATPPDAACWHFGPKPRTARFWSRRQAHETAMHAADATLAAGATPGALPADFAVDGIDEVVTMFFPRQVHLGRTEPLSRSLALAPDDAAGRRWVLAGGGTPSDDLPACDATLTGPADALLRVLWKRLPLDAPGVRLDGDPAAASEVLAVGLTP